MANLNISTLHTGGSQAAKLGIHSGSPNSGEASDVLDSLFMTELDAAGLARLQDPSNQNLGQNTFNVGKGILEDSHLSLHEADQADINTTTLSLNLNDAMLLAAGQLMAPSPTVAQVDVKGAQLSPADTLTGVANQQLLNALTSATTFTGAKISALAVDQSAQNTASQVNDLVNTNNFAQNSQKQQATNSLFSNLLADQVPLNTPSDSSVVLAKAALNPQINFTNPLTSNMKVSSLSDAIAKLDGVKVFSLNQGGDTALVNSELIKGGKTEAFTNVDPSGPIQVGTSDAGVVSSQVSEIVSDDSSGDKAEESLISQTSTMGFMANPSFTNHQVPVTNLKLEAVNTSLASGPLHSEILASAKSGGGRISLEVHPDNAGPIRIDLQIDQGGQARLVVHGASDATQARLQQGGDQLRQEFSQMGLNLMLDMGRNSSNNASNQTNNPMTSSFSNNSAQQFDTNTKNSNRISNIEATSHINTNVDGDMSGVDLIA